MRGSPRSERLRGKNSERDSRRKGRGKLRVIPARNNALEHRADIDGLRAIAAGCVLAFHLGISKMRGGFGVVDVSS